MVVKTNTTLKQMSADTQFTHEGDQEMTDQMTDTSSQLRQSQNTNWLLKQVTDFQKIWEYGNEETGFVSFFRPKPEAGFFCFGDIAERGSVVYPSIPQWSFRPDFIEDSDFVYFLPPLRFNLLWTDQLCSIWEPIPPENYRAIGCKIQRGISPPDLLSVLCVHQTAVDEAEAYYEDDGSCLWPNLKADTFLDLSIWRIRECTPPYSETSYFTVTSNFSRPTNTFFTLKQSFYDSGPLLSLSDDVITTEQAIDKPMNDLQIVPIKKKESPPLQERDNHIYYLPIEITKEFALEALQKWVNSLWFAPTELRRVSNSCSQLLQLHYLPFYVFTAKTATNYQAEIENSEKQWESFAYRKVTDHHDFYAPAFDDESLTSLVESVGDWHVSRMKPREFVGDQQGDQRNDLTNCKSAESVWTSKKREIELKMNVDPLPVSYDTSYRNLSVATEFIMNEYSIVLLPVFIAVISIQAQNEMQQYKFIINAQTGKSKGLRPGLSKSIPNLTSTLFGAVPGKQYPPAIEHVNKQNVHNK